MRRIIQNRKTWFWIALIGAIIVLDVIIFTPGIKQNNQEKANALNKNLEQYIPIYGGVTTRSLFSLRSDYYYEVELKYTADSTPTPRNLSDADFMGYYIPGKTQVIIKCKIDDPIYYPDGIFEETAAEFNLTLGTKTLMLQGKGSLKGYEIRITLDVRQIDLDIKIEEEGLLWNTYSPSKAYFLNLDAKRVKIVKVYKKM